MKKYFLISSLLAVVLLIVGGIGLIATGEAFNGMSINVSGDNFINLKNSEAQVLEKEFDINNNYTKLNLNVPNSLLKITKGTDDKIYIKCTYNNNNDKYTIEDKNGEINITRNDGFNSINILSLFNNDAGRVEIIIPESVTMEYQVEATNGSIDIEGVKATTMSLRTSNGNFEVSGVEAENEIEIRTTNGRIVGENLVSNSISFESTNGLARLTNVKADKIYTKTTNGLINAEDCYGKDVRLITTNGAVTLENSDMNYVIENLDVNTTNGKETIKANYNNRR